MNRYLVHALGIFEIFAWGSSYYLVAVLAGPIVADTGWPLEWVVGSLSLGLFTAGLVAPHVGRTIGNRGGRSVLVFASLAIALALLLLAASPNLVIFVLAWIVMGVGMASGLYDATFATLGGLYGQAARRSITTLTLWGGFASTVCWPLSAILVEWIGWRGTCLVYAVILVGFCMPLILAALPRSAVLPTSESPAGPPAPQPLSRRERQTFWLLASVLVFSGLFVTIVSVHLLTLLQAQGLSLAEAVALGALIGPAQVGARVIEMAGRGRHHPLWTLTCAILLCALGLALMASGAGLWAMAIILYGAGNGIFSIARGALPLAIFGKVRYAAIMGQLARPSLIAQASGPVIGAFFVANAGPAITLNLMMGFAFANVMLLMLLWAVHLSSPTTAP